MTRVWRVACMGSKETVDAERKRKCRIVRVVPRCLRKAPLSTLQHECPLSLSFAPIRDTLSSQQIRATLFGDTNATTTSVAGHMGYCANGRDVLLPENVNVGRVSRQPVPPAPPSI